MTLQDQSLQDMTLAQKAVKLATQATDALNRIGDQLDQIDGVHDDVLEQAVADGLIAAAKSLASIANSMAVIANRPA